MPLRPARDTAQQQLLGVTSPSSPIHKSQTAAPAFPAARNGSTTPASTTACHTTIMTASTGGKPAREPARVTTDLDGCEEVPEPSVGRAVRWRQRPAVVSTGIRKRKRCVIYSLADRRNACVLDHGHDVVGRWRGTLPRELQLNPNQLLLPPRRRRNTFPRHIIWSSLDMVKQIGAQTHHLDGRCTRTGVFKPHHFNSRRHSSSTRTVFAPDPCQLGSASGGWPPLSPLSRRRRRRRMQWLRRSPWR